MNRAARLVVLASIALAFIAMGAVFFLDWLNPTGTKPPDPLPGPAEAERMPHEQSHRRSPDGHRDRPAAHSQSQTPAPAAIENAVAASAQAESVALRAERRRLARALLEEFRKPENAAPDSETTTHPALFLPDGKPVDPYMLPPLQLPAAMTIENPAVEITTDLQVGEWERLQDEFIAEVGGKMPTDPESRKIWIQAQRKNDDRFRLKFGTEAFLRQQMDAYRGGFLQK